MRSLLSGLVRYGSRIGRRWILLLFLAIDAIALLSQVFIPQLLLPVWAYAAIFLAGLFLAAYQEHSELLAQLPMTPLPPPPYELLPFSYQVSFSPDVSSIAVWLYAVNFQGRELILDNVLVTSLELSGGPSLREIRHPGIVRIPARSFCEVWCHRDVPDGEVRALRRTELKNPTNATAHIAATGVSGRRTLHLETSGRNVNGWFVGTPPNLAPQRAAA